MFETEAKGAEDPTISGTLLHEYHLTIEPHDGSSDEDLYHLDFTMAFHEEIEEPVLFHAAFLDSVKLRNKSCEKIGQCISHCFLGKL